MNLGPRTEEEEIQLQRLLVRYRTAFRHWSAAVSRSQSRALRDALARRRARGSAEAAQSAYRDSRDSLAAFFLTAQRSRVRRLAYQLWERAGRPRDSAEADWEHAERLIRGR